MAPTHDWLGHDPGTCAECGAAWELVRPGKTQPTCSCQDKCSDCGLIRGHYAQGVIGARLSGFLCPNCDADEELRPGLIERGIIPRDSPPPRPPVWMDP